MIKVATIILTYNSKNYIKPCLDALFSSKGDFDLSVIIVDNNSPDLSGEYIEKIIKNDFSKQNIKFIQNKQNNGFAAGINTGIVQALKYNPDFIFLLNPDTKVTPQSIESLLKIFKANDSKFKNVGIVGAQMIYSDGTPQGTFGNFPNFKTEFLQKTRLYKILPFGRFIPFNFFSKKYFQDIRLVDWVSGGAMMIKKEVIKAIGLFDENYFMYIEDIDFCRRAKNFGFSIVYNPHAKIWHKLGASSQNFLKNDKDSGFKIIFKILRLFSKIFRQNLTNIWQKQSLAYYFKKWQSGLPERFCRHTKYHLEPAGYTKLKFIFSSINNLKKKQYKEITALDIGCGNGNIAFSLAALGLNVIGVDIDDNIIIQLNDRAANLGFLNLKFINIDANNLESSNLSKEKFDVIIMSEILEHLKNPTKVLADVKKLLNQDGFIILSIPNKFSLEERIRQLFQKIALLSKLKKILKNKVKDDIQSLNDTPHLHYFSYNDFLKLASISGFKIIYQASQSAGFKSFFYIFGRFFLNRQSPIFQKLDNLDSFLAKFLPARFGDGMMFTLKLKV